MADDSRYCKKILEHFFSALEKDRARHAPRWMIGWAYQDKRDRRHILNPDDCPQDFYSYNGPQDLARWWNWQSLQPKPDYFLGELVASLVELSRTCDQKILQEHSLAFDMEKYPEHIGRYNAQDYLFQNFYPVPSRFTIHRILDFGAGYGRQANLWIQQHPKLVFVGMDAIPLSYCLQHLYYSNLPASFSDYVRSPSGFVVSATPGLYHVPTWRTDLLPEVFFDLIICVQVLQELNARLLEHMLGVFQKVLKPGGCLYIRDHENWRAGHFESVSRLLLRYGFELEFKPHLVDRRDIHGIPRLWRKVDPEVRASQVTGRRLRVMGRDIDLEACLPEVLTRTYRKIKGSLTG